MKSKLFFLSLISSTTFYSQAVKTIELKINDSIVPKTYHEVTLGNGFSNANKGTVDFFSTKSKYEVSAPKNYIGLQDTTSSGSNYFGLISYNTYKECKIKGFKEVCTFLNENYAEFLQIKLPNTLGSGKSYEVSFKISLADYSGFATTGWGVYFSDKQLNEATNDRLSVEPSISFADLVKNKKDWVELKGMYEAKGNENFMVLGVFAKNFKTEAADGPKNDFGATKAYYYLSSITYKEVNLDRDKDGIPDKDDKCPDVKGVAAFAGCPDTDGDGIQDSEDTCPTVAGIAQFKGCPDTDGDGIQDSEDACPTVKGVATFKGCPDTDGDGVADNEDKCITIQGTLYNNGCPEAKIDAKAKEIFKQAMTGVQFETGKDVIKKTSYSILDNVANVLKSNPTWDTDIEGHTDNVGNPVSNKQLSQKRAEAVKKYLTDKGVTNKMTAIGYGLERPIADNKTAAGKTKNRRVEFRVTYEQ